MKNLSKEEQDLGALVPKAATIEAAAKAAADTGRILELREAINMLFCCSAICVGE